MKKWSFVLVMVLAAVILAFILNKVGLFKTMSPEILQASIDIVDVETQWVSKSYQVWPPKLTLVPSISFKVKNVSDKPLKYINFNAIFRMRDDFENLGDNFLAAIRGEPIMPGEMSETILLKSNYGVEGKTLASFPENPYWKIAFVQLFAQSKGSQLVKVGEWEVSRKIDFKEDEAVAVEPVKKKEEEKR